mgnify:CR=1 FL=1
MPLALDQPTVMRGESGRAKQEAKPSARVWVFDSTCTGFPPGHRRVRNAQAVRDAQSLGHLLEGEARLFACEPKGRQLLDTPCGHTKAPRSYAGPEVSHTGGVLVWRKPGAGLSASNPYLLPYYYHIYEHLSNVARLFVPCPNEAKRRPSAVRKVGIVLFQFPLWPKYQICPTRAQS